MTAAAPCSSVIIMIPVTYNYCHRVATATPGGIYAISCWLALTFPYSQRPESRDSLAKRMPMQYTCLRSTKMKGSRCHLLFFFLVFQIQKDEGKQVPLIFLFPRAAVVDLIDLSFAAISKFPIFLAPSGLQRLRRWKGLLMVLALQAPAV